MFLGRKDSITLVNLAKFLYDKVNPGSSANFGKLLDVTIYSNMSQNSMGSIFRIVNSQNVTSEVMISRKNPYTLLPNGDTVGNYTLRLFEWGLQLDLKEEVYRDELSFITTVSYYFDSYISSDFRVLKSTSCGVGSLKKDSEIPRRRLVPKLELKFTMKKRSWLNKHKQRPTTLSTTINTLTSTFLTSSYNQVQPPSF